MCFILIYRVHLRILTKLWNSEIFLSSVLFDWNQIPFWKTLSAIRWNCKSILLHIRVAAYCTGIDCGIYNDVLHKYVTTPLNGKRNKYHVAIIITAAATLVIIIGEKMEEESLSRKPYTSVLNAQFLDECISSTCKLKCLTIRETKIYVSSRTLDTGTWNNVINILRLCGAIFEKDAINFSFRWVFSVA